MESLAKRLAMDPDLTPAIQKQLLTYIDRLLKKNEFVNLTRITDPQGLYEAQIRDSMQLLPYLPKDPAKLLDLGTGAGFPGLVLKILRPDLDVTLLDSVRKKLDFLDEVIEALSLKQVRTLHARAEDVGRDKKTREQFDVVTARAVANMPVLLEYSLPLVKVGGSFLALKTLDEPLDAANKAMNILGGKLVSSKPYTNPSFNDPQKTTGDQLVLHHIRKIKPSPKKYPRRAGSVRKDPIL